MKLCYCDETGTGVEPFAVMVGVVVDSSRMHVTKSDWADFLKRLSSKVGKQFQEFHTRNFYSGSGIWKSISGEERTAIIQLFLDWFVERKHHIVFSCIDKTSFDQLKAKQAVPPEIGTVWSAMACHLVLSLQKYGQSEEKNKGNTLLIFDEEVHEKERFESLILSPPDWSDSYYSKTRKQEKLDQIVDIPYFADSKHVHLIQVSDFISYFIRRYVEIQTGAIPEKFSGESERIKDWFDQIMSRSIGSNHIYPKRNRCKAMELFWALAPACILGVEK